MLLVTLSPGVLETGTHSSHLLEYRHVIILSLWVRPELKRHAIFLFVHLAFTFSAPSRVMLLLCRWSVCDGQNSRLPILLRPRLFDDWLHLLQKKVPRLKIHWDSQANLTQSTKHKRQQLREANALQHDAEGNRVYDSTCSYSVQMLHRSPSLGWGRGWGGIRSN